MQPGSNPSDRTPITAHLSHQVSPERSSHGSHGIASEMVCIDRMQDCLMCRFGTLRLANAEVRITDSCHRLVQPFSLPVMLHRQAVSMLLNMQAVPRHAQSAATPSTDAASGRMHKHSQRHMCNTVCAVMRQRVMLQWVPLLQ